MNSISTKITSINSPIQQKIDEIVKRIYKPSSQKYLQQIVVDYFKNGKPIALSGLIRKFLETDDFTFSENTFFIGKKLRKKYGASPILGELIMQTNEEIQSSLINISKQFFQKEFMTMGAGINQDKNEVYIKLLSESEYLLEKAIQQGKILKIQHNDITIICDHNKGSVYDIVFGE